MNRSKHVAALVLLILICGGICALAILSSGRDTIKPDMVAISRLAQEVGNHWSDPTQGDYSAYRYDFAIVDTQGKLLYQSAPNISVTLTDAIRNLDSMLPITAEDHTVGTLIASTHMISQLAESRQKSAWLVLVSFLILTMFVVFYGYYLDRSILRPFRQLKNFSKYIAAGNLDIPLQMAPGNIFGAFTEAFDLMRTQLAAAREKERLADRSKKELVASLSHDIKTPVTSIKLLSELMLITEKETRTAERLHTMYDKADQIDQLITDLFQSCLEDLGELQAHPTENSSRILAQIIRDADYEERTEISNIPDCLVLVDSQRLEQVIGNIISNSYKYADTTISVNAQIIDDCLQIAFRDYGSGVESEELPRLTGKFYRGKNADQPKKTGAGLGLYIADVFMGKMGGSLCCRNCSDGFVVEISLTLAQ